VDKKKLHNGTMQQCNRYTWAVKYRRLSATASGILRPIHLVRGEDATTGDGGYWPKV
jgi:hypothetical protein